MVTEVETVSPAPRPLSRLVFCCRILPVAVTVRLAAVMNSWSGVVTGMLVGVPWVTLIRVGSTPSSALARSMKPWSPIRIEPVVAVRATLFVVPETGIKLAGDLQVAGLGGERQGVVGLDQAGDFQLAGIDQAEARIAGEVQQRRDGVGLVQAGRTAGRTGQGAGGDRPAGLADRAAGGDQAQRLARIGDVPGQDEIAGVDEADPASRRELLIAPRLATALASPKVTPLTAEAFSVVAVMVPPVWLIAPVSAVSEVVAPGHGAGQGQGARQGDQVHRGPAADSAGREAGGVGEAEAGGRGEGADRARPDWRRSAWRWSRPNRSGHWR